jgi:hypothetical protein
MPFVVGGSAPLGAVLGSSSLLGPLMGSASLIPILGNGTQSPAEAGETAAMPPLDVVYEPSASQDGALLTYAPPRGPDGDGNVAEEATTTADGDTNDDDVADADLSVATAALSSVRTQFAPEPVPGSETLAMASPVSVQVARATQALQASQIAPAVMPGLATAKPTPAQVADPHAQSQLVAQAVYALIADAHAHGRDVDDLIKFA